MIAVDTSVLIAILMDEPEKDAFIQFIASHQPAHLCAVSFQEAGMIICSRRGPDGVKDLLDLVAVLRLRVAAYDEAQAQLAIDAFARYGKGMGTAAKLNMGDCATYGLATFLNVPLLYKGDDFTATEIAASRIAAT